MSLLRVGVIGVGAMGSIHAEHLASRVQSVRLTAIADVKPRTADALAQRFGGRAYDDYRDLVADPEVDAVVIATPRHFHVPIIIDAAAAGKHIFCEKPIANTIADADQALAAVEQAGVVMQIGFHRHFDANFQQVHHTIASGNIGEPQVHPI